MQIDETPLETFKRHFDEYMNYVGAPHPEPGILKVSYQFLTDSQEGTLAEMVGFVRRVGPAPEKREFLVIEGFRR